jgi:hypothetical protein
MVVMNLVIPKAAVENELLLNKLASASREWSIEHLSKTSQKLIKVVVMDLVTPKLQPRIYFC